MGLFKKLKKVVQATVVKPVKSLVSTSIDLAPSILGTAIGAQIGRLPVIGGVLGGLTPPILPQPSQVTQAAVLPGAGPVVTPKNPTFARQYYGQDVISIPQYTDVGCPPGSEYYDATSCINTTTGALNKRKKVLDWATLQAGGVTNMSFASTAQGALRLLGGGGRLTTTAMGGGLVRTVTGRISSIVLPSGARYSRKRAASLIRRVGFEVAATALGLGVYEAAEILLADSQSGARRRARGISGADIRTTCRTLGKVKRLSAQLGTSRARAPARRRTCK